MEKLITKFNSIKTGSSIFLTDDFKRRIYYEVEAIDGILYKGKIKLPYSNRPKISTKIVASGEQFENGFKVVRTENGEFAYIRETDNKLLPYRYDIASDFNEYGLAMVSKDGCVSWINQQFQYFSRDGEMVEEDLTDEYRKFEGFQEVHSFSTGKYPLARISSYQGKFGPKFYVDTNGNAKKFYKFNGEIDYSFPVSSYNYGDFKDKDYKIGGSGILFSKGYYVPLKYLLEYCQENGIINSIYETVDECFEKDKSLKLIK